MRIAIVGSRGYPYVYSGYETFVSELAPRLVQKGHDVTVYCHRGLFGTRPKVVNDVKLVYVPAIESKTVSQLSHTLLSTLRIALMRNVDVVLCVNSANGPLGWLLRAAKVPSAINVDGMEWLRPKWKGAGARYFRWASRQATQAFNVVITDAAAMADVYRDTFGAESTMIAYGANLSKSKAPERVLECGVAPGEYYLVVGRLIPDNNGELIVRGFERTSTERKLLVLGDVPYHDAYVNRVRQTTDPRIIFPGYVRDGALLNELYCNAHAYLHGHEFGGTNPSLLTALASGCAVSALDTRFNREVLADETHGIYFGKTPESVSTAITRLEEDAALVRSLRAGARSRITEAYTWERIASEYDHVISRLTSSHAKV